MADWCMSLPSQITLYTGLVFCVWNVFLQDVNITEVKQPANAVNSEKLAAKHLKEDGMSMLMHISL